MDRVQKKNRPLRTRTVLTKPIEQCKQDSEEWKDITPVDNQCSTMWIKVTLLARFSNFSCVGGHRYAPAACVVIRKLLNIIIRYYVINII